MSKQDVFVLYDRLSVERQQADARIRQLERELAGAREHAERVAALMKLAKQVVRAAGRGAEGKAERAPVVVEVEEVVAEPVDEKEAALQELDELDDLDAGGEDDELVERAPVAPAAKTLRRRAGQVVDLTEPVERKARKTSAFPSNLLDLSIVDAAIAHAKAHGRREAKAEDVERWFLESGYKTETRGPSRNSIYVSLNREHTNGEKKGAFRVRRVSRGVFHFTGVPG